MALFVKGRKRTKEFLKSANVGEAPWVWMHVASLGEFEQGLPILERIRSEYPSHKVVLTFFSPSGYEVKKDTKVADQVLYLPMDTRGNAKLFLNTFNPVLAIFVKYEIWPNYLMQLKQRKIPTLLVSAIFSKRQVYFKPWGGFMRKNLRAFSHFFVQEEQSKLLLESVGHENVTVGGDTRFDRVSEILKRNNQLDFMERFKNGNFCFVAGSTWPEDEAILVDYINKAPKDLKFVLAPHTIKPVKIEKIKSSISKSTLRYSEMGNQDISNYQVLIVDTIGLLTKIYSYADVAYVGGAFATGLHNTLEPAVFGIPVIIGPEFEGFKEAENLVHLNGIQVVHNSEDFNALMHRFVSENTFRKAIGKINSDYIQQNVGATESVLDYVRTIL
ncbi:3-deoxy-D-manno-octulosonic acid transferase [Flagellimonas myxillae]|uniref:3-deoxy-D-manno-octulosonic acid transferase n=1 Tax=Flagellimonas myxillae TaxID=2942214 RepID=UPI00201EF384|nr:glycosyltransferase N-terminal domain-containing protein [Muricauda myxillae]MCL6267236.1 3-deoxy-D-manno-octulosonic acid transferase [Muricauda myxillae]